MGRRYFELTGCADAETARKRESIVEGRCGTYKGMVGGVSADAEAKRRGRISAAMEPTSNEELCPRGRSDLRLFLAEKFGRGMVCQLHVTWNSLLCRGVSRMRLFIYITTA